MIEERVAFHDMQSSVDLASLNLAGLDLDSLAADYRLLAQQSDIYFPDFAEFRAYWNKADEPKMLALAREGTALTGLACFSTFRLASEFSLGGSRQIRIPMAQAGLFGGRVLGSFSEAASREVFRRLFHTLSFDMLTLDDLPGGNGLYDYAMQGAVGRLRSVSHRKTTRRVLALPESYDSLIAALKPSTAKAIRRDRKLFDRLSPVLDIIASADGVAGFLSEAAAVSRRAGKPGSAAGGIEDTPAMREWLHTLAEQDRLRAYLVRSGERVVACAWGDIANGVFYFRATTFDPEFGKYTPGRAIMLDVFEDLIALGTVRVFDFGIRDFPYKERFANRSFPAASIRIARRKSWRGQTAVALHQALDRGKRLVEWYRARREV